LACREIFELHNVVLVCVEDVLGRQGDN